MFIDYYYLWIQSRENGWTSVGYAKLIRNRLNKPFMIKFCLVCYIERIQWAIEKTQN